MGLEITFISLWYAPWIVFPLILLILARLTWKKRGAAAGGLLLAALTITGLFFALWIQSFGSETGREALRRFNRNKIEVQLSKNPACLIRLIAVPVLHTPKLQAVQASANGLAVFQASREDLQSSDHFKIVVKYPDDSLRTYEGFSMTGTENHETVFELDLSYEWKNCAH